MKTWAGNRANMIKRPDYRNKIIIWPDEKVDFLKRSVFLNKINVGVLNIKNTIFGNKVDVKQEIDSRNGAVI